MKYYIYKYVRNNEIIYIGQTINLNRRHKEHLLEPTFHETDLLYYFVVTNKYLLDLYETALINKYHPILNKQSNYLQLAVTIQEPNWKIYKDKEIEKQIIPKVQKTFVPKEYSNIFINNINNYEVNNINNIPNLSITAWRLLIIGLIKQDIITINDYSKMMQISNGGKCYEQVKKAIEELSHFHLIKTITKNSFSLTNKAIILLPFPESTLLKMLSFKTKYGFPVFLTLNTLTSIDDWLNFCNYSEVKEVKRKILQPALNQINTIFDSHYKINTIYDGHKIKYIQLI